MQKILADIGEYVLKNYDIEADNTLQYLIDALHREEMREEIQRACEECAMYEAIEAHIRKHGGTV